MSVVLLNTTIILILMNFVFKTYIFAPWKPNLNVEQAIFECLARIRGGVSLLRRIYIYKADLPFPNPVYGHKESTHSSAVHTPQVIIAYCFQRSHISRKCSDFACGIILKARPTDWTMRITTPTTNSNNALSRFLPQRRGETYATSWR